MNTKLTPEAEIVNKVINEAVAKTGTIGHLKYKVIRAVAYQAFLDVLAEGGEKELKKLVAKALKKADKLPSGWALGTTNFRSSGRGAQENTEQDNDDASLTPAKTNRPVRRPRRVAASER